MGVFRSCLHWKTEPRSRLLARNHWGNGESAVTAKVGQSFRKRFSRILWLGRLRFFWWKTWGVFFVADDVRRRAR